MQKETKLISVFISVFILGLFSLGFSAEELTITTYYPSPYGVYNILRLNPSPTDPNLGCANAGEMYYHDGSIAAAGLYVCNNLGVWQPSGGETYWAAASPDIHNTNDGYVGIGTSSPATQLHIQASSTPQVIIDSGAGGTVRLDLAQSGVTKGIFSAISNELDINTGSAIPLNLGTDGVQRVAITSTGNVGIGTTTPGEKLEVIGNARTTGDLVVDGNTTTNNLVIVGLKSAAVPTSQGMTSLYSIEAADSRFEDFGSAQLINGEAEVRLDPLFLETVTISEKYPMVVTLTLTSDSLGIYVAKKTAASFVVKEVQGGIGNVTFDYRVTAMRKGFENKRLELVNKAKLPKKGG